MIEENIGKRAFFSNLHLEITASWRWFRGQNVWPLGDVTMAWEMMIKVSFLHMYIHIYIWIYMIPCGSPPLLVIVVVHQYKDQIHLGTHLYTHWFFIAERRPLILRFGQCLLIIAVLLFQQAGLTASRDDEAVGHRDCHRAMSVVTPSLETLGLISVA